MIQEDVEYEDERKFIAVDIDRFKDYGSDLSNIIAKLPNVRTIFPVFSHERTLSSAGLPPSGPHDLCIS